MHDILCIHIYNIDEMYIYIYTICINYIYIYLTLIYKYTFHQYCRILDLKTCKNQLGALCRGSLECMYWDIAVYIFSMVFFI